MDEPIAMDVRSVCFRASTVQERRGASRFDEMSQNEGRRRAARRGRRHGHMASSLKTGRAPPGAIFAHLVGSGRAAAFLNG